MRFYIVLLICSIVTFSSRFAPFLIFKDGKVNEMIGASLASIQNQLNISNDTMAEILLSVETIRVA